MGTLISITSSPDDGRDCMISLELVESDFIINLWWAGGDVRGDELGGVLGICCIFVLEGSLGGWGCIFCFALGISYNSVYSECTFAWAKMIRTTIA